MGIYELPLAGESYCQPACRKVNIGDVVRLTPEPENRYDPRAIRVVTRLGERIGYVPRESWVTRVIIDEDGDVFAVIKKKLGGTRDKPTIGIVLALFTALHAAEARSQFGDQRNILR